MPKHSPAERFKLLLGQATARGSLSQISGTPRLPIDWALEKGRKSKSPESSDFPRHLIPRPESIPRTHFFRSSCIRSHSTFPLNRIFVSLEIDRRQNVTLSCANKIRETFVVPVRLDVTIINAYACLYVPMSICVESTSHGITAINVVGKKFLVEIFKIKKLFS